MEVDCKEAKDGDIKNQQPLLFVVGTMLLLDYFEIHISLLLFSLYFGPLDF